MKNLSVLLFSAAVFLLVPGVSEGSDGSIVAWGLNYYGECDVPEPNEAFVAVTGGYGYSIGLKEDGSIVAWGYNNSGQCDVPEPNEGFAAVASGYNHSLGLKEDGSIVGWGWNYFGQCDAPEPNEGFVAIAVGYSHSLGLKEDGSIVAWGNNGDGQCNVSEPNEGFVAVAAGYYHSLGLKEDSSMVAWGSNNYGECYVPEPNEDFVTVAGGSEFSLGLKENGSIVAWGDNWYGQCNVPEPNEGFVAVAGGHHHSLGLKENGSIVAWGHNGSGQCNVPEPNEGFVTVAAGAWHSFGLHAYLHVIEPDSSTTWTHFEMDIPVVWTGVYCDSVSIILYDGAAFIDTLAASAPNTGSWVFTGPVPMSWVPGIEYMIYIEDDLGYSGWSEEFTVAPSEGAEIITVTEPDASTTWNNIELDRMISWSYPALPGLISLSGDSVSITLYKNSVFVDTLISSTPNTGTWVFNYSLPLTWESGSDYRVHVVDNLANHGWSEEFIIEIDLGINLPDDMDRLYLFPVSPNPSDGLFTISYCIPQASEATVVIYDLAGKQVYEVANGELSSSLHQLRMSDMPSGVYFCRLRVGADSFTERFVVIR